MLLSLLLYSQDEVISCKFCLQGAKKKQQKSLLSRFSQLPYLQVSRQAEVKLGFRLRGETGGGIPVRTGTGRCVFLTVYMNYHGGDAELSYST